MRRLALLFALFCALPLRAQEEPTPFWLAPPPPPPAKKERKSPPGERAPAEKKRRKPAVEQPAPVEKRSRSRRPPTEPEEQPLPARRPAQKTAPVQRPPAALEQEAQPEPAQGGRRPVRPLAPAPEPGERVQPESSAPPAAAPARVEPEAPAMVSEPIERGAEPVAPRRTARRFALHALGGLWGKPRSDGGPRFFDFAYGLDFSYAPLPDLLEVELVLARSGDTFGNGFSNASASENLIGLRAFYVLPYDRFALLLGGGPGAALVQTHYTLHDVGADPLGLDAVAARLALVATGAVRARIAGGFEARVEISAVLRDGRVEVLPLLGAGAVF